MESATFIQKFLVEDQPAYYMCFTGAKMHTYFQLQITVTINLLTPTQMIRAIFSLGQFLVTVQKLLIDRKLRMFKMVQHVVSVQITEK